MSRKNIFNGGVHLTTHQREAREKYTERCRLACALPGESRDTILEVMSKTQQWSLQDIERMRKHVLSGAVTKLHATFDLTLLHAAKTRS